MNRNDLRFQQGAPVHAKAIHLTSLIECHRRYGSNAKTKLVNGVVCRVETVPSSTEKRAMTMITANFALGGNIIKTCTLNSKSVKAGHVTAVSNEGIGPGTQSGTYIGDALRPENDGVEGATIDGMPSNELENNIIETVAPAAFAVAQEEYPQEDEEAVGANVNAARQTVVTANGIEWVRAGIDDPPLNGNVPPRVWSIRNVVGEVLVPGQNMATTPQDMSPLDFFLLMFPPKQLLDMVEWTNVQLNKLVLKETSGSELLKLFGLFILTTKFEFTKRTSLWQTTASSKYRPAPQFGLTGMSKHRFEDLFRSLRWSLQPDTPDDGTSSEQYRWKLVDDFVKNFNDHRANYFNPSDQICVDESMSRWYGQGGHWINHGLPQYVAIDRKPENGCEIQNAACGRSGVMLRLKLVKGVDLPGAEEEEFGAKETSF